MATCILRQPMIEVLTELLAEAVAESHLELDGEEQVVQSLLITFLPNQHVVAELLQNLLFNNQCDQVADLLHELEVRDVLVYSLLTATSISVPALHIVLDLDWNKKKVRVNNDIKVTYHGRAVHRFLRLLLLRYYSAVLVRSTIFGEYELLHGKTQSMLCHLYVLFEVVDLATLRLVLFVEAFQLVLNLLNEVHVQLRLLLLH